MVKRAPEVTVSEVAEGIELLCYADNMWGLQQYKVRTDVECDRALDAAYRLTVDFPDPEEMRDRLAKLLTACKRACAACPNCAGTGTNRITNRCGLCFTGLVFAELVPRRLAEAMVRAKHVLFSEQRTPR